MSNNQNYRIKSFNDILSRLRTPRFKEFVRLWDVATRSSKRSSKIFFLQCINFSIAWLLIFIVLPHYIDQITAGFANSEYLFLPAGKMILLIISWIIGVTIPDIFGISWVTVFEMEIRMTLYFMVGLIIFVIWLFWGLIVDFKNRLIYDFSLWRTSK